MNLTSEEIINAHTTLGTLKGIKAARELACSGKFELTIEECSKISNRSQRQLEEWVNTGRLKVQRYGKRCNRYRPEDLWDAVMNHDISE